MTKPNPGGNMGQVEEKKSYMHVYIKGDRTTIADITAEVEERMEGGDRE